MASFTFTSPEGKSYTVNGPDGATKEQAFQVLQGQLGQGTAQAAKPDTGIMGDIAHGVGNLAAGAIRGAGSIGATILAPYDIAKDAINGKGLSLDSNRQRRAAIDGGLQEMGANPDSFMYKAGKLGGEIAGTAGAGGLLAKGVEAVPVLAKAIPNLAPALASGGFRVAQPAVTTAGKVGNALIRTGAGAAVGGATAGVINPDEAKTGAILGAAMPGGVKVAGMLGSGISKGAKTVLANALGASTGTGADAVRNAYAAGKNGATDFLDNMRGNVSFNDVVAKAKDALGNMRLQRAAEYRNGMAAVSGDKSVIPFQPIQDAVNKISAMGSFKGQQINKNAAGTVGDLADTVSNWAGLNPAEYHTPEGLDALKQAIGDIRDSTQFGTSARRAADTVYNAVKNEITAQAPVYSKVMKDYSSASETLGEIEKALSLGNKASKDTAVRKLQSLMRNNAATNYGNRLNLAKTLETQGGQDLLPSIAGQAMSSAMPRGIAGAMEKAGAGGAAILHPASIPALALAAPLTSPRMVGEALYKAGAASGATRNALNRLAQPMLGNQLNPALMNSGYAIGRTIPLAISASQRGPQ